MHYPHIPLKEITIDVGLMFGVILAIFTFGLAALPYMPGEIAP